jgi:hypothetical protein
MMKRTCLKNLCSVCSGMGVFILVLGCANNECRSGTVPIAVMNAGTQSADLPPDFGFTTKQVQEAISGLWTDAGSGVSLEVTSQSGDLISYTLDGDEGLCTTGVGLPVVGQIVAGGESTPLTGVFEVVGTRLEQGILSFTYGASRCTLEYGTLGVPPGPDTLMTGSCNLSSIGLQGLTLLHMTRSS